MRFSPVIPEDINAQAGNSLSKTTSRLRAIENTQGFERILKSNDDRSKYRYYQANPDSAFQEALKHKYDFVLLINKAGFRKGILSGKRRRFEIHYDLFDKNFKRIEGGRLSGSSRFPDKMYPSVFFHELNRATRELIRRTILLVD